MSGSSIIELQIEHKNRALSHFSNSSHMHVGPSVHAPGGGPDYNEPILFMYDMDEILMFRGWMYDSR